MGEHTTPEVLARLATLEARLAAQEAMNRQQGAELARHRGRQRYGRSARRILPVVLAALLVALVPLSALAVNPFTDLTGGPHDGNIDAIFNAGITKGCDPTHYCPTANVTREEMASFLARTAGLGGNPPVANALTAQTATNATTAQNAVTAQTATSAANAQNAVIAQTATNATNATNAQNAVNAANAGNANTVGGYAPSALTRLAFSSTTVAPIISGFPTLPLRTSTDIVRVTLTVPGPATQVVYVRGAVNLSNQTSGGYVTITIRQDGAANTSGSGEITFPYQTTSTVYGAVVFAEWAFVAPPGTHTYTLVAYAAGMAGPLLPYSPSLVATTHPFGNAGNPGTFDLPPDAPDGGGNGPQP